MAVAPHVSAGRLKLLNKRSLYKKENGSEVTLVKSISISTWLRRRCLGFCGMGFYPRAG